MIRFDNLRKVLQERNISWNKLQSELNVSPSTIAKLQKNRNCQMVLIDKVCEYLNVQPGDIMEYVNVNYSDAEIEDVENQIAKLQEKLNIMNSHRS